MVAVTTVEVGDMILPLNYFKEISLLTLRGDFILVGGLLLILP